MKLLPLVLTGALLVPVVTTYAKIERTVEKTFTVTGAGTVRLETSGGSVSVMPGADGVVKITARERIDASSEAEADKLLQDLELTFDQSGADVRASARYTRGNTGFHFRSWPPVQVDFIATVPAAYAADLRTHGGSITVGDLAGVVAANTSGGSIKLGKLGNSVDARTSGGGITLAEARKGATLKTSGGNIAVGRVAGPAELHTSGGSISIESVEERVTAHTSGGSIRASLAGPLKSDCTLETSGGSIRVAVSQTAAFYLDAETSGGSVNANGVTIKLDSTDRHHRRLSGDVNGGGPKLKLRTSGGSINVDVK